MKIYIINGPNLNLLGQRETNIYGTRNFEEYLTELNELFSDIEFIYFQSNIEGEIINKLQEAGTHNHPVIINPGGYSHTSVSIADCISAIHSLVVEVHISNVHTREDYRKQMLTGSSCRGIISGLGMDGYTLAVRYIIGLNL